MHPKAKARLAFMVSLRQKLIVIRPFGDMPVATYIDQLFGAYANVEAPWTFNRLIDLRRHERALNIKDILEIAMRWKSLTAGTTYRARVAIVSDDRLDKIWIPEVLALFPNDTLSRFSDYYQAMAWLNARNGVQGLKSYAARPSYMHAAENS